MELTVFTPVYNRKELLKKLFVSLLKQSSFEFIWMIVDDGSTDGVAEEISAWKVDAPFEIQLIQQNNQGKHVAHNTAVKACMTNLFVCVDSDDELMPDAVKKILEANQREAGKEVLGFYFRKVDTNGVISGGNFQPNNSYIGLREIYHKYGFKGELVIVLKSKYAKMASFPVFPNEKFVSELVYYNEIDGLAPMCWIDDVIYRYEYQETGYSKNSNRLIANNPYGAAAGYFSEAQYATKILQRVKAYSEYLAISDVFDLKKVTIEKTGHRKVNLLEKALARVLINHYKSLFIQIQNGER